MSDCLLVFSFISGLLAPRLGDIAPQILRTVLAGTPVVDYSISKLLEQSKRSVGTIFRAGIAHSVPGSCSIGDDGGIVTNELRVLLICYSVCLK